MKTIEKLANYKTALRKWKETSLMVRGAEPTAVSFHLKSGQENWAAKNAREEILGR